MFWHFGILNSFFALLNYLFFPNTVRSRQTPWSMAQYLTRLGRHLLLSAQLSRRGPRLRQEGPRGLGRGCGLGEPLS